MSQKSPLELVNEKFGGKDKLVDKLVGLLESDEPKEDLRKRLLAVANGKLLRLHKVATTVKETYGSRDKLLDAALAARTKDKDFRAKMEAFSSSRLVDIARIAERRAKAAQAAAAQKPKKTAG
jgi:hypothetical protein